LANHDVVAIEAECDAFTIQHFLGHIVLDQDAPRTRKWSKGSLS